MNGMEGIQGKLYDISIDDAVVGWVNYKVTCTLAWIAVEGSS